MKTRSYFMRPLFAFGLALLGLLALTSVSQAQWTAYNDHVPGSGTHSNTTTLKIPTLSGPTSTNIVLKNSGTGSNLTATLYISRSAAGVGYDGNGVLPASGTPL